MLTRRLAVSALLSGVVLCATALPPSSEARAAAAAAPSLTQAHNLSVSGTVLCTGQGKPELTEPFSSAAVGDLFGNGQEEIVAAFSDGYVYAWYASNYQVVPGWPKQVADGVASSPAIAVLDGDTLPSIIVDDYSGTVNVWNGNGVERAGWPQHSLYGASGIQSGFFGSVAVGDLYGDGRQELFASALDQHTYAWFSNGTAVPGWPKLIWDSSLATPALADLQDSGELDVVTPSDSSGRNGVNGGIYWVWGPNGQQLWWSGVNEVPWSSPAVADFGGSEVIVNGTGHYYSQTTGQPVGRYIVGLNANGTTHAGYPTATNDVTFASPAVGDLLGNGGSEVVDVTENGTLYAVDQNGNAVPGFPLTLPGEGSQPFSAGPAIAPVDSTGRNGIYVPSPDGLIVYSMADLGSPTIEPLPGGATSFSTPTIANLGSGGLSAILTSASGNLSCGATDTYNVTVWTVNGTNASQMGASSWPTFHGNMQRSGSNLPVIAWQAPASLGATVAGTLHPISWGPGNEDVFWRGTDGNLWQEYSINGTWYGPQRMTTLGNLASDPQPISWGSGNEEVFWRGTDGNLWQMYYLNGWQGPASLGDGPLGNATPVPISWGVGNIEVFWEGTDQNVWEAYYANGWHGPVGLGDGPLGTATLSAVSWGTGNLELFWKGTDKNLWEAYYANGWHGPQGLGDGPLGSAPHPVASQSGVLDVFWEGTDGNLWHAWYLGGAWNGPGSLGSGPMGSQPEVTSWGGGRVDVFWVGTDGNLWHDWYQNGWTGPQNLGGTPLDSLPSPVTTGQPGYIDVVWTGPNSTLWHATYTDT
jgi:hypothetical protein